MSGHRITDPAINMYAASKFAVNALTEGLRRELRQADTNIRVTVSMNKLCSSQVFYFGFIFGDNESVHFIIV